MVRWVHRDDERGAEAYFYALPRPHRIVWPTESTTWLFTMQLQPRRVIDVSSGFSPWPTKCCIRRCCADRCRRVWKVPLKNTKIFSELSRPEILCLLGMKC